MPIYRSVKSAIERSKLVFLTLDGKTLSAWEWSKTPHCQALKINYKMLLDRKKQSGWDDLSCLTTPKRGRGPKAKTPGNAPIHLFKLGKKRMSAKEWESTEWCRSRQITAPMLRTRRECGWNDTEALTVPKVRASEIANYRREKAPARRELTAPEFYAKLHRMAAEWGVN